MTVVEEMSRFTVLPRDVPAFLCHVADLRYKDGSNHELKITVDGGGGFFKVAANLTVSRPAPQIDQSMTQLPVQAKKTGPRCFKDSGVKKSLLLSMAEDIQENYDNMKKLCEQLDVAALNFDLACDLKLGNILMGLQSHGAAFPCIF